MPWTVEDILAATGGELVCGDRRQAFGGLSIDSRTIAADEAFIAIRGGTHDGHAFVDKVIDAGIRGLIVAGDGAGEAIAAARAQGRTACVAVADTTRALGDLGAFHRRRSPAAVAAVTGSNGKTSTRRMIAGILSQRFSVLEPERNLNNQIGLPLTLLRLTRQHQWAVLELGTNMPGEIARLAEICTPDIGVITNIGPAHLEGLGSLEGVLREKAALLAGLAPGGRAVLNADDPRLRQLTTAPLPPVGYGLAPGLDVRAERVQEGAAGIDFELQLFGERTAVHLNALGRFMVHNALAAAAVGHLTGFSAEEIREGLARFSPVAGRMQLCPITGGIRLIDDTYNANPDSMGAALRALQSLRGADRGVFVAGEMRELGPDSAAMHRETGRMAGRTGIHRLYACGPFAAEVAEGAREAGLTADSVVTGSRGAITRALLADLRPGDWVLVKGSRAAGMEEVVAALKKGFADPKPPTRG